MYILPERFSGEIFIKHHHAPTTDSPGIVEELRLKTKKGTCSIYSN